VPAHSKNDPHSINPLTRHFTGIAGGGGSIEAAARAIKVSPQGLKRWLIALGAAPETSGGGSRTSRPTLPRTSADPLSDRLSSTL
jgi:hypothetical protein